MDGILNPEATYSEVRVAKKEIPKCFTVNSL